MNTRLVTTGLVPLVVGSVETFVLSARINGLPWDMTGGSVTISFKDPNNSSSSFPCVINKTSASYDWTVVGPEGTWTMAFLVVDAAGRTQKTNPIVFTVTLSP